MRWPMALLLVSAPLAGCLGGDGDGDDPSPTTEPPAPTAPPAPANATRIEMQAFDGSVTTVNGVVAGVNTVDSDTQVTFPVPAGGLRLTLNVTASGGELEALVAEPGCQVNEACETGPTTSGGAATIVFDAPLEGTWSVRFFGADAGPSTVQYTLDVALVVPADDSTAA